MKHLLVVSLVLAACGGASPAMRHLTVPTSSSWGAIGSGANDIWSFTGSYTGVNHAPVVYHYDGTTFAQVQIAASVDWLTGVGSACSAGPGAVWITTSDGNAKRLYKLSTDGNVEDHSSELPSGSTSVGPAGMNLVAGDGIAFLHFTTSNGAGGSITTVLRNAGAGFAPVGTIDGVWQVVKGGQGFILVADGNLKFKRFDGTTFVDEASLPAGSSVYGFSATSGFWAWAPLSSDGGYPVYEFKSAAWVKHTPTLPAPPNGSEAFAAHGLAVTGPGHASMILGHGKRYDYTEALAAPISGDSLGDQKLLYRVADCNNPPTCAAQVSPASQLGDGTLVLQFLSDLYLGAPGDI